MARWVNLLLFAGLIPEGDVWFFASRTGAREETCPMKRQWTLPG